MTACTELLSAVATNGRDGEGQKGIPRKGTA